MSRRNRRQDQPRTPRVPPAEQLLIDELPRIAETRLLCTTVGRGQFAIAAARGSSTARVVLHEFDVYQADLARQSAMEQGGDSASPGEPQATRVEVVCTPDFPDSEFDLAALPTDPRGEAELTRDLLQQAHERLIEGGRLIATTSNAEDQWLHTEMRRLFAKVTRRPSEAGVLYLAKKDGPLKKRKHFDCEFAFRDQGRLIKAVSRPGVFNHRGLDGGARALLGTIEIVEGMRVLELGCGSGVVSLAAACRAPGVAVTAIDSHARAIDCTIRGAALNGLTNIRVVLGAEGECDAPGTFDLAVGNPPYFSDYRISEIFLQAAARALRPSGAIRIVTKALEWYRQRIPELFDDAREHAHKTYVVFEARQRGG